MHTTMISASMTAYSTAVGPSSVRTKSIANWVNFFIASSPVGSSEQRTGQPPSARSRRKTPKTEGESRTGVQRPGQLHVLEGLVGVAAQRGDGGDADDDDQRQHDRVLDGRRAVLGPHEAGRPVDPEPHVGLP